MIIGSHIVIYTKNAEADREFLRDVLGFDHVDAGDGWLLFTLPPAEAGVHPSAENDKHELYLMTDDIEAETARLQALGVDCEPSTKVGWGILTRISLPGGGKLGLYQPRHALAIKS